MNWRVEPPEAGEELSFGDDPGRESRLSAWESVGRTWVSAHRKLLAAVAAFVVLLGALGAGGRHLYQESRKPLPPPDVALPVQDRFVVVLCGAGITQCQDGGAEAAKDVGRIEADLVAIPEVARVRFRSGEAEFERVKKEGGYRQPDGSMMPITRDMFADGFEGVLRSPDLFAQVAARGRLVTGVADVWRTPTEYWTGKANVTVILCGTGAAKECAPLDYESPTERQRQAIVDRIREVDGVEQVYFEDRRHALRLQKHYYPEDRSFDPPLLLVNMQESFRVKIAGPDASQRLRQALKNVPGVEDVR
ncbi:permease-like cell division protein FtsX [Sphaerisporangium rhizosphaerae]|uniref:Permease-like cell division protein FtsX n=1 Tax=Sphaerisporangium rhizosphaerae TaxID=2269375 RepID=A0ABW2P3K8_9ACTN